MSQGEDNAAPSGAGRRRIGMLALRVLVSFGVIAALFWVLPTEALLSALGRVKPEYWGGLVAGFLGLHALSAFKWGRMLSAAGVAVPFGVTLRAHLAGLFANLCLPSVVGGDVIRAGLVMRSEGQSEGVALASLADRVNDTLALVALSALAALAVRDPQAASGREIVAGVALAIGAGIAAAALAIRFVPVTRLPGALARVATRVQGAFRSVLASRWLVAQAMALSFGIQAALIGLNVLLAVAMGIDVPVAVWFLAWPLAKLLALAPVSLGGIGVREVAMAGLLAPFGVVAAEAVAQSLAWEVVLVVGGLLAGATTLVLGARIDLRAGAAS